MYKILAIILTLAISVASLIALGSWEETEGSSNMEVDSLNVLPEITFLEFGSTTCVPCKKMEPILKNIQKKYGTQIKVDFIDLAKNREAARKHKIKIMPTQIFLDKDGNEIHRHMGYYPEKQIDEFLHKQGLVPIKK